MKNLQLPIARKEGLVVQEMPDEILIYDLETDKAHCLNRTAAFVWEACDGKNSVTDITRLFGDYSGSPVQEDLVWLAIDQLSDKKLLEKEIAVSFNGQTRREAIKKIGLATVIALPIVSSLIAPVAASAATGTCANPACTCTLTTAPANNVTVTCRSSGMTANGTSNCPAACTAGCTCDVTGNSTGTNTSCTSTCSP